MAILKRGNSVWRGTHFFEWRNFHELKILYEDNVMIHSKYIFWDSWAKLVDVATLPMQKKWPMFKKFATLNAFLPRQAVADA